MFTRTEKKRIYLDWASAAPVHTRALTAFTKAATAFGNPSSPHTEGRTAHEVLEESRTSIARLAGVKSQGVIFTSGATEANNLAIQGRVARLREEGRTYNDIHIVYLPTMHSSVLNVIEHLSKQGVRTNALKIKDGAIDLQHAATILNSQTVLVCVDAICGETGIRYDTLKMRRILDSAKLTNTALLLVDASQLPLVESIDRTRLGADFVTIDAQKVGGIRGIGALVLQKQDHLSAITFGGGQEDGLRPGTEPVALAAAFAEALSICSSEHTAFAERARAERALLIKEIQTHIPQALIIEGKEHAPHILTISLPGLDTDYAVTLLDTKGYAVSTRSACETNSEEGSKAVQILTGDSAQAKSTLRISWGPTTDMKKIRRFPKELAKVVNFLQTHALV